MCKLFFTFTLRFCLYLPFINGETRDKTTNKTVLLVLQLLYNTIKFFFNGDSHVVIVLNWNDTCYKFQLADFPPIRHDDPCNSSIYDTKHEEFDYSKIQIYIDGELYIYLLLWTDLRIYTAECLHLRLLYCLINNWTSYLLLEKRSNIPIGSFETLSIHVYKYSTPAKYNFSLKFLFLLALLNIM